MQLKSQINGQKNIWVREMINVSILKEPPKDWDKLVENTLQGTFFQTTMFANVLKKTSKVEPVYIIASEQNKILGILLCFKSNFGHNFFLDKPFGDIINSILLPLFLRYEWIYGPVIFNKKRVKEVVSAIVSKVNGVNISSSPFGNFDQEKIKQAFEETNYSSKPFATFLVDLKKPETDLLKNIKKETRKNIRRCQNKEVLVRKAENIDDLKLFYNFIKKMKLIQRIKIGKFEDVLEWWKLSPNYEIYMAFYMDEIVAVQSILSFNNYVREMAAAQKKVLNLYPNDLLKWEILLDCSKRGMKIYDFAGVSPDPKTIKEKNIYRFKSKWGGNLVKFYTFSK
jgi:hypothetical protein